MQASTGPLSIPEREGRNTAYICYWFNNAFDSVNAHLISDPNAPLRCVVTAGSAHHQFWEQCLNDLKRMQFVNPLTLKKKSVPSLRSWVYIFEGFQKIWKFVESKGFSELKTRIVSQDPLENYFGRVRSFGGRNITPSCRQFAAIYKSLLITNVTSAQSLVSNCESTCDGEMLFAVDDMISDDEESAEIPDSEDDEEENVFDPDEIAAAVKENFNESPVAMNTLLSSVHLITKRPLKIPSIKSCERCTNSLIRSSVNSEDPKSPFESLYETVHMHLTERMPKICHFRKITKVLLLSVHETVNNAWIVCDIAEHRENLQTKLCS